MSCCATPRSSRNWATPSAPWSSSRQLTWRSPWVTADGVGLHVGHGLPDVCVVPVSHAIHSPGAPLARSPCRSTAGAGPAAPRAARSGRRGKPTLPPWTSASPATTTPAARRSGSGWRRTPAPRGRAAGRGRLRGAPLGPAVRPRCRSADPARHRRGAAAAGVRRPINPIGIGWAGPTLMYAGTDEQKERWLWPLLSGRGVLVPALLRARGGLATSPRSPRGPSATATTTSSTGRRCGPATPTSPGGASCWPAPIRRRPSTRASATSSARWTRPGIEIRPLVDMTGEHAFNEVFFTDVRIPADHLVGAEHGGWELAKVTLGNERVSLSGEGALWGMGPTADDLVDLVRRPPAARPTPPLRDRLVAVWIESQILRVLRLRMVSAVLAGKAPGRRGVGPQGHRRRPRAARHGRRPGPGRAVGMLAGTGPGRRVGPRRGRAGGYHLVPGLPLRPGAHGRGRDGGGPAQHRGRKGARVAREIPDVTAVHTSRTRGLVRRATAHACAARVAQRRGGSGR